MRVILLKKGERLPPLARVCPMCSYSLVGLPETYTCPECGMDYDPNALVIPISLRNQTTWRIGGSFFFLGGLYLIAGRGGSRHADAWLIVPIVMWLLDALILLMRSKVQPRSLIVNRFGVRIQRDEDNAQFFPWDTLLKAEYSRMTGRFHIRDANNNKLLTVPFRMFGTARKIRQCVSEINRLKQVYSTNSAAGQSIPSGQS